MKDSAENSWARMAKADQAFENALRAFLNADKETRITILRNGLNSARQLTLRVLEWVPVEERKELLPDLLYLARAVHGYLWQVRRLILSFPKDWLLEHIEAAAEPILESGDLEYREFLQLYNEIDSQLARRLAERAIRSDDPEIRQTGEEFMEAMA